MRVFLDKLRVHRRGFISGFAVIAIVGVLALYMSPVVPNISVDSNGFLSIDLDVAYAANIVPPVEGDIVPASPAFPTVEATNTSTEDSATTSHTVSLPAGIQAGDLLLMVFGSYVVTTVNTPSGWTKLGVTDEYSTYIQMAQFYKTASGSEGSTVEVTTDDSTKSSHVCYRISGWSGTPEKGTAATSYLTHPDPPRLSPSWGSAETLWIAVETNRMDSNVTAWPTNYTGNQINAVNGSGSTSSSTGMCSREYEASTDDPGEFTISANRYNIANTIAIQPATADIDVGSAATDRGQNLQATWTFIDVTNPANDTGEINHIEIWAQSNISDLQVGSFYLVSGTTYKCRASATIGSVTAGSQQTFDAPGDFTAFSIESGDFIGCYYSGGALERDTSGGSGVYYNTSEYIDPDDEAEYTELASNAMSLYGEGSLVCSEDITNTPSSWSVNGGTPVDTSSEYSTGLTYFSVTNNSGGAVDITISGTDMTGSGWVSPSDFDDYQQAWDDEIYAYDGDTGTYASTEYGFFLSLLLPETISCSKVRVYADGCGYDPDVDIEVFYDGSYHNIFSGYITRVTWVEKEIGSTEDVSAGRVEIGCSEGENYRWLYEFQFWQVGVWTLSDTATPGDMTYGLKAGLSGGDYTIIVKKNSPFNTLVSGLADEASQSWGLKLYTPTVFDDGFAKSGTVTLTATCS